MQASPWLSFTRPVFRRCSTTCSVVRSALGAARARKNEFKAPLYVHFGLLPSTCIWMVKWSWEKERREKSTVEDLLNQLFASTEYYASRNTILARRKRIKRSNAFVRSDDRVEPELRATWFESLRKPISDSCKFNKPIVRYSMSCFTTIRGIDARITPSDPPNSNIDRTAFLTEAVRCQHAPLLCSHEIG